MATHVGNAAACYPASFSTVPPPFGTQILAVTASPSNFTRDVSVGYRQWSPELGNVTADFCNVTITYTHPGQNDRMTNEVWLPLGDGKYNGRLQSLGGGGFVAGRSESQYGAMLGAVVDGFAAVSSDAGLVDANGVAAIDYPSWVLASEGNINLYNLENLGSRALGESAEISKDIVSAFFGTPPEYSYFTGCSQGGRQALALAQRYPDMYDGIIAAAPAVYIAQILGTIQWPQQVMNILDRFPYNCETLAIAEAAASHCDALDGVKDGVIDHPELCLVDFDPFSLVGTSISHCSDTGTSVTISEAAAKVLAAYWAGPVTPAGESLWYGPEIGSGINYNKFTQTISNTFTTSNGSVGVPSNLGTIWLSLFLANDDNFDVTNVTSAEYARLMKLGTRRFQSLLDANDPDLRPFRDAGGKMITFHGLADSLIPPKGTEQYYNEVSSRVNGSAQDFYRYFETPGIDHCAIGPGGQPYTIFSQLRDWVENGTVPETVPVSYNDTKGVQQNRILCPYPQGPELVDGNAVPAKRESWRCVKR